MESAFDAYYIIQKFNLPEEQQLKIYELIKSHNWLDRMNNLKDKSMLNNLAQDIAFDARHTNTFELAKILCEADLKSVKRDASFFNKHKGTLDEMSTRVDKQLKRIKETQIFLPQTKIPQASSIEGAGCEIKSHNGIQNTVIYMNDIEDDLSKIGFEQGATKSNWAGLVHALEYPEQMNKFDTFSVIDSEALLSTSYMNANDYRVFRKQGFILDVNTNDIHAGYFKDFGTGYSKDVELLKMDYLFKGTRKDTLGNDGWRSDRTHYRDYISGEIKKALGVDNEEYIKLMQEIQSCKSISDIRKVNPKLADTMESVFSSMDSGKRKGGRKYNEMLVTRPKIQGVFAYDKPYEKIPEFLRKYARDNNLPILIFGKH